MNLTKLIKNEYKKFLENITVRELSSINNNNNSFCILILIYNYIIIN
jgi:hypothetical protein